MAALSASAQAVRVDPQPVTTIASNVPTGAMAPVLAIPGASIHLCGYPSTGQPCTNLATTYTDATASIACPSDAQVVPATGSSCTGTADEQGNFGFWVKPGLYAYTITLTSGQTYGPYPVTEASSGTNPDLLNTAYNFSLPNQLQALSAGVSTTVTLVSCPAGVKGTDTGHYLYVSGTGTAETVLVTGGTCAAADSSGTLIFRPANNHTAGWTLSSATAGINEAFNVLNGSGGTVRMPQGFWLVYSQVHVPSFSNLIGSGMGATTLRVANGFMKESAEWALPGFVGNYGAIVFPENARSSQVKSFTLDLNGSQNITYTGTGIGGIGTIISVIQNVEITNASNGLKGISPILFQGFADGNIIDGNVIENQPGCATDNTGPGGIVFGGTRNRVTRNYVINTCGTNYSAGSDSVVDSNSGMVGSGTMSKGNQMYMADSASHNTFTNNTCIGNGVGPACYAIGSDIPTVDASYNTFANNRAQNCGDGFLVQGAIGFAAFARNNSFVNNMVDTCIEGAFVTNQATGVIISGNQFLNSIINGIDVYAQVLANAPTNVIIEGNYIDHTGTAIGVNDAGITCDGASTWPCALNLTVQGNIVTDTATSHVMDFAMRVPLAAALTNLTIAGNTFTNSTNEDFFLIPSPNSLVNPMIGPNTFVTSNTSIGPTSTIKPGFDAHISLNLTVVPGANENVNIGNSEFVRFTSGTGAAFSVGGFTGGIDGRVLYLLNTTGQQLTINNNDAGSSPGNKILTLSGANVVMRALGSSFATFIYDANFGTWLLVSTN